MGLKPYCVLYRDNTNLKREFCCYADDAYHARLQATELIQHVQDHPNSIVHIRCEESNFDW